MSTYQSCGSGAGKRSTYSISIISSNETFRSVKCLPNFDFKNSPLMRKSNSIAVSPTIEDGSSCSKVLRRLLSSFDATEA